MPRTLVNKAEYQTRRFNDYVRGELKRKKLKQKELAEYLNVQQSSISHKLIGRQEWSLIQALNTAEFLGVELSDILK